MEITIFNFGIAKKFIGKGDSMTALVIIAKNEERSIERCIASFRAYVEEIILCDTGSNDKTIEIAKKCGAIIYTFSWNNDFSAARNYALDKSSCKFNIVADADEWLVKGGPEIAQLKLNHEKFVGQLKIVNTFELNGKLEKSADWISRILPKDVRYEGLIHEQPVHNYETKRTGIEFFHDGYEPEQQKKKVERNYEILSDFLVQRPGDAYLLFQMGRHHEIKKEFTKAANYYEKALTKIASTAPYIEDLIARSIYVFKKTKKYQYIKILIQNIQNYQSADIYFSAGDALLDYAIDYPNEAKTVLPVIEKCWLMCLEIGEGKNKQTSVLGRGSFLAAENLKAFYLAIGENKKAEQYAKLAITLRKDGMKMY